MQLCTASATRHSAHIPEKIQPPYCYYMTVTVVSLSAWRSTYYYVRIIVFISCKVSKRSVFVLTYKDSLIILIVYSGSTVTFGTPCRIGLISKTKLKPPLLNKDISRIFAAFYTTALIQIVHGRQVQFLWRLLLRVAVQVPDEMGWRDTHPKHKACGEHLSMLQRHNQH